MSLTEIVKEIRGFYLYFSVVTLLTTFIARSILSEHGWYSYAISIGLVTVVLISLTLSVYLFFLKKNIALLMAVIVFKWPILAYLVYSLTGSKGVNSLGFALGILPLIVGALIWAVRYKG